LVTGASNRLWSAVVGEGADPKETANVLANAFVATGIDPERVSGVQLAKLVKARAEIPRAAFDEALARVGDDLFSAEPYLAQKAVSDVGELGPGDRRILRRTRLRSSSTAAASRACSASSSAR